MFKVNKKETKTTSLTSFWFLYCSFLTYLISCPSVSIANFEKVNADKEKKKKIDIVLL